MAASSQNFWDESWLQKDFAEINQEIYDACSGLRWKIIRNRVLQRYASFKGLDVVELGSGLGKTSLVFNFLGASTTLIDYSENALNKARLLFDKFGCKAALIKADALDLPGELLNKFDISLSCGLAEHFIGNEREGAIKSHAQLLKHRGMSIIMVPNVLCLPYQIWRGACKLIGKWRIGIEVPFTPLSLKKFARVAGFSSIEVVGAVEVMQDIKHYILKLIILNSLKKVTKKTERQYKVGFSQDLLPLSELRKMALADLKQQNLSILTRYFGSSLVCFGYKD